MGYSHHILHVIEPFEAFHASMSKANDLVQAFRDRQEILAQASNLENFLNGDHGDTKTSNVF